MRVDGTRGRYSWSVAEAHRNTRYFHRMDLAVGMREVCLLLIVLLPCLMVSNRLGVGGILGLIVAGFVIGPGVLDLIEPTGSLNAISELGIVLFLFLIGLELNPARLGKGWRRLVLLGVLQVGICGAVLTLFLMPLSAFWVGALIGGFTLAMSSTALALQGLKERGELDTALGRSALAILVVQDMAVVPLLAMVPILNPLKAGSLAGSDLIEVTLLAITALGLVIILNRFIAPLLISHLDRRRDATSLGALAALLVLGSAVIVEAAHLPMTLGAFVAGVALSTSPASERLEHAVRPHQTLFLSLFFVTVGMSIEPAHVSDSWAVILVIVPAVIVIKTLVIAGLGRLMGHSAAVSLRLGLGLAQVGEFGFVVTATSLSVGWATPKQEQTSTMVIALTMVATPLIELLLPRIKTRRGDSQSPPHATGQ